MNRIVSVDRKNKCVFFVSVGYILLFSMDYLFNVIVYNNGAHTYELLSSFLAVVVSIYANRYISGGA